MVGQSGYTPVSNLDPPWAQCGYTGWINLATAAQGEARGVIRMIHPSCGAIHGGSLKRECRIKPVTPETLRTTVQELQQTIAAQLQDWCLAVCSSDRYDQLAAAILLPQLKWMADSPAELLALPLPSEPRWLVICDDNGADGGALELTQQLRERHGSKRTAVIACVESTISTARLDQLWRGGVDGLICHGSLGRGLLLQAITMVLRGGTAIDPVLAERLRAYPAIGHELAHEPRLNNRELDLLRLLAHGRRSQEIAALLHLRCDTIRRQLSTLYRKTGVANQNGLIRWGLDQGLIRLQDLGVQRSG